MTAEEEARLREEQERAQREQINKFTGLSRTGVESAYDAANTTEAASNELADKTISAGKELGEKIQSNTDTFVQGADRRQTEWENAQNKITADAQNVYKAQREAIEKANNAMIRSNEDVLNRYIKEAELARQENEIMTKADNRAVRWTGAAELGAAIANLIGVANGASNQQYHSFSQDWMKKSEQDRKDRVRRLDSLKDRRNALEQQIAQLRAGAAKDLAGIDLQSGMFGINQAGKLADAGRAHGDNMGKVQYDAGNQVAQILAGSEQKAAEQQASGKMQAAQQRNQGIQQGIGTKLHERQIAIAASRANGRTFYRPAGVPRDAYPLTINGKAYWVNDDSLIRNVEKSIDKIAVYDDEEIRGILENEKMKPKEKAELLLPYIEGNPEVAEAIITSSFGEYTGGPSAPAGEGSGGTFDDLLKDLER